MAAFSSISVTLDMSRALEAATRALMKREVAIGIPDSGADRKPVDGQKSAPSNALLGYLNEHGDDEKHIPARPFLLPGIEGAKSDIVARLEQAGRGALDGNIGAVDKGLTAVGLVGQNAVRQKITDGPFAPLSARTIQARAARGRKGAKQYLKLQGQGVPVEVLNDPGVGLVKPLIDTSQLLKSITSVVRDKGAK